MFITNKNPKNPPKFRSQTLKIHTQIQITNQIWIFVDTKWTFASERKIKREKLRKSFKKKTRTKMRTKKKLRIKFEMETKMKFQNSDKNEDQTNVEL